MVRPRQRQLQRTAFHAINDSNRALMNLLHLKEEFEREHSEYVPLFEAMAQMQLMFQESMADLFIAAWGRHPDSYAENMRHAGTKPKSDE